MAETLLPDLIITHRRRQSADAGTIGDLFFDGVHECLTLEDDVREPDRPAVAFKSLAEEDAWVRTWKKPGITAIPARKFRVVIDWSDKFQKLMIHLLDVPGFTGIRAHAGGTPADTEGCVLLGEVFNDVGVLCGSSIARDRVFGKISRALLGGHAVWWDIIAA